MYPTYVKEREICDGRTVVTIRRVRDSGPVVVHRPPRESWRGINPKRQRNIPRS